MNKISFLEILVVDVICLLSITIIIYRVMRNKNKIEYSKVMNELSKEKEITSSIHKINHELKNPLAICLGYLKILPTVEETKKEQYLNIINEELNRGLTIISDFSNIRNKKELIKEELDLTLLLEEVKEILSPIYKEQNGTITIKNTEELYVNGDYSRLKEVFINILKNSLEAKSKETINVSIGIKKINNNYRIIIKDNGKGMTEEELSHIFEMFYTTKNDGTGIGIPLIKEIIDLHQGRINYKSNKNNGTTVTIVLPIV